MLTRRNPCCCPRTTPLAAWHEPFSQPPPPAQTYQPAKLPYGFPHPDPVVETSSLSAVPPPDVKYSLGAHPELVDAGVLSALQLESVVYACQRHEQVILPFLCGGEGIRGKRKPGPGN